MKFLSRLFPSKRAAPASNAVGMIVEQECDWFRTYAADIYRGTGAIVDLGCFMGSTTISLAQGLRFNRAAKVAKIHAYDRFLWENWMQNWWEAKGLPAPELEADSFLPEFLKQTSPWKDRIIVHHEDIAVSRWDNGPIEFLLVDVMKSSDLAESITRNFFSFLVPGKSYVAHQDFVHSLTSWIHLLQFRLRNSFAVAADIPGSGTVVFRYRKQFSPEAVGDLSITSAATEELEAAFDYSLGLVSDSKKPNVVAAKAMAYLHRGDVDNARAVVEANRWGSTSLGQELEGVEKLIGERSRNP
ncbi:MAG: hypothetical protein QOE26_3380 [Verrucomicrobiota bacterium]|jgi:hypothetical protein